MRIALAALLLVALGLVGCGAKVKAMGTCQVQSFSRADTDRDDFVKACMQSNGYVFDGGHGDHCSSPITATTPTMLNPQDDRCYSPWWL